MLGFLSVRPPLGFAGGARVIESFPSVPAEGLSGLVVRRDTPTGVEKALGWCERVRILRPSFVFGLVAPPEACFRMLGVFTQPVPVVVPPEDLEDGCLPVDVFMILRNASVEGRILEELRCAGRAATPAVRATVRCLVSHGVRGGTVNSVAAELGCSTATVWRRVTRIGLKPRVLMSWARLRAYELRIELGDSPEAARRAGGWLSRRAWEKGVGRIRRRVGQGLRAKEIGGGAGMKMWVA